MFLAMKAHFNCEDLLKIWYVHVHVATFVWIECAPHCGSPKMTQMAGLSQKVFDQPLEKEPKISSHLNLS